MPIVLFESFRYGEKNAETDYCEFVKFDDWSVILLDENNKITKRINKEKVISIEY